MIILPSILRIAMAQPRVAILHYRLRNSGGNAQELVNLQAGPADQGPVDVGLAEQFGGVVGLDAAPVLNPHHSAIGLL